MSVILIESRTRSLVKGVSYRVLGTLTTIGVAWLIVDDISAALQIGVIELFGKIGIFYLHERVWAHIPLGRPKPLT